MHEHGKSDNSVVPAKPPNKAGRPAAEVVEGRGLAKGNTVSSTRPGLSAGPGVPSGLDRVREVARRDKEARFTALLHHVDLSSPVGGLRGDQPEGRTRCGSGDVGRLRAGFCEGTSKICSAVSTAVPTGRALLAGCTYLSRTGGSVRSVSPPWRTRSSNGRWLRY